MPARGRGRRLRALAADRRTASPARMRRSSPAAWCSADLRGVDTHGLCRLPIYLDRLRRGLINPRPALEPKRVTPVAASLDGKNGFGFVIGMRAMREAIAMAREFGIGVVSVRRSTHFGMAASYVLPAVEAGLDGDGVLQRVAGDAAVGRRADAARHQSVLHGRRPAGKHRRSCSTCRRRSRRAAKSAAPSGAARRSRSAMRSTREGRPTTDPKAALGGGVVLPIGEHKGSGLAMFMDIFGGVISGAEFRRRRRRPVQGLRPARRTSGHFFLAMKPNLFVGEDDYRARMDTLIERVRACPTARRGSAEVLVPGRAGATAPRKPAAGPASPTAASEVAALQEEAKPRPASRRSPCPRSHSVPEPAATGRHGHCGAGGRATSRSGA